MNGCGSDRCDEGHRFGGPLSLGLLALLLASCGGGPAPGRLEPGERAPPVGRPLDTYERLGFLTGPAHFPAVATLGTIAGPADSTYALVALSLPSSALRFRREAAGFAAEYVVVTTFSKDSQLVKRAERRDTVRVATFAETGRTDESVVHQDALLLAPGRYELTVQARDANSSRGFRARETVEIPRYGASARRLAQPLVVYQAAGRTATDAPPGLIMNPRHTVAYGAAAAWLYVEAYGAAAPVHLSVRVLDEAGSAVWSAAAVIEDGDSAVRHTLIEVPADTLPLGRLWIEVRTHPGASEPERTPLVVSISDQWMVANFDEVLAFLEYIAAPAEVDSLRTGTSSERRRRWESFWAARDPLPATPLNEFREQFFQRLRVATEQFSEPGGVPGWRTDRGEVYIVLGAPDFAREREIGIGDATGAAHAVDWIYESGPGGRLQLVFVERSGFGNWELTPATADEFRAVAERLKRSRR